MLTPMSTLMQMLVLKVMHWVSWHLDRQNEPACLGKASRAKCWSTSAIPVIPVHAYRMRCWMDEQSAADRFE